MLTIGQIIHVSHPTVRTLLLDGRDWVSPELRALAELRRLTVQSLGPCIVFVKSDGTNKHTEVSEITIPMCWTADDDQGTEAAKIEIAGLLLRHAFEAMDQIILEKIGTGRAVASKEYRYDLGLTQENSGGRFTAKLYTAIAFEG